MIVLPRQARDKHRENSKKRDHPFLGPTHPPPEDMFENWNLGKVVVTGNVVEDTPWWESVKDGSSGAGSGDTGGGGEGGGVKGGG